MNVSSVITTDYENKSNWTLGENKPKQSQFTFYRGERGARRAKENMRNFLPNKEIQSESSFSVFFANSAVNEKQTQSFDWIRQAHHKSAQDGTKPISDYPCVFELAVYNLVLRNGNVPNGRDFDGEYTKWQMDSTGSP